MRAGEEDIDVCAWLTRGSLAGQAVLRDASDQTEMRLVYANQTEEDILLRKELDAMATDWRLTIHYVLSKPPVRFPMTMYLCHSRNMYLLWAESLVYCVAVPTAACSCSPKDRLYC